MSYGLQTWGLGSWGGSDFVVNNHIPSDSTVGTSRLPSIQFTLFSQSGNVVLASINMTVNGTAFITNGVFTSAATGTIDDTNPAEVDVTVQTIHEFAPLALITVVVAAINTSNQPPTIGNTWQFTVDDTIHVFQTHISRKFERVFGVNDSSSLSAPQNPHAESDLSSPQLIGTIF